VNFFSTSANSRAFQEAVHYFLHARARIAQLRAAAIRVPDPLDADEECDGLRFAAAATI
jgi:hypothetical protein